LNRQQKQSATILSVALDSREELQIMVDWIAEEDGKKPDYTFLSDPGHLVVNRYGLWNPNVAQEVAEPAPGVAHRNFASRPSRGYTNPATFVIDRLGVVRHRYIHDVDQRVRPTNRQIARDLAAVATTPTTPKTP
jgi:peroxiredoxin